jgi:lipopolysaccharide export system protein LptA
LIKINRADFFHGDELSGIRKLIGNVEIQHENTIMYCDSAFLYGDNQNVDAFSNITINAGDSVNIFGELLHYNSETKIADIHDSVIMRDGNTILTTDSLTYNLKNKTAFYQTGAEIKDGQNELTSVWGFYYTDRKQFYFRDSVILVNPDYTLYTDTLEYNSRTEVAVFTGPTNIVSKENHIYSELGWYDTKNDNALLLKNSYLENKTQKLSGDSLYYDKKSGLGKAYYNVVITDTVQKMIIKGGYGEYNEKTAVSIVTIDALLIQIGDADSLYLHADTLKAIEDTVLKEKTVFAYYKAKFFKPDLQGMSDSLVYKVKDSTMYLYYNPVLWSEENQLSADSLTIFTSKEAIKSLYLYNSSFIISKDDSMKYNQIKGKNMIGYFEKNELVKINVYENSETIYYVRDEKQALIGINKAESINLLIYLKENKVNKINFLEKPKATLYPEKDLAPNDLLLRNFKWEESRRPKTKKDIFIW